MSGIFGLAGTEAALIFLLGLRHGLDPDHVAVIDNMTFRAAEERPGFAPWVGTFFAVGHSLSVATIALIVSAFTADFVWPTWVSDGVEWAVIVLLILVGLLNLRALQRRGVYVPTGWRHWLIPGALRGTCHPMVVLTTGLLFGLVFDTATQAAAWGAAASATGGVWGAAAVAAIFATGMILTDTADSRIVASLLKHGGALSKVRLYRRAVGWIIVALSFGTATYALTTKLKRLPELSDALFTTVGATMAFMIIAILLIGRGLRLRGLRTEAS